MNIVVVCELVGLPGVIWLIVLLRMRDELGANKFALIVVAYISLTVATLFQTYSMTFMLRIVGDLLSLLVLFPGYLIARLIFRRLFG
jgi:uncharacterized membrane protein YgaE (UPF0421/DUF939 family)